MVARDWEKRLAAGGAGLDIRPKPAARNRGRQFANGGAAPAPATKKTAAALAERAAKAGATAAALPAEKEPRPLPPGFRLPKTLGACADALYRAREERLALNRQADALEAVESALKDHLVASLPKSDSGGIAGRVALVKVGTKPVPQVQDWAALYAAVVKDYRAHAAKKDGMQDGAFALLNRALTRSAVEEAWRAGREVPGVVAFNATVVSVTKL